VRIDAMDDWPDLVVEDEPDPHDLAFLEERLAAAAVAAAGVGEEQEFAIFMRDGERVVAGVSGSTWGGCCQLHVVWVDDAWRGRGLAKALLSAAEVEAGRRGCRLLMGLTYDVLTAGFYDRLGWETVGVIEDCPKGTATRWYRKDL
jgi:GNAT superfamily N-acetyltransferase